MVRRDTSGPQVGQRLGVFIHTGELRGGGTGDNALQLPRPGLGDGPRLPQRLPSSKIPLKIRSKKRGVTSLFATRLGEGEAVEGAGGGQRLQSLLPDVGPAGHILDRDERPDVGSGRGDALGYLVTDAAHRVEPQPHRPTVIPAFGQNLGRRGLGFGGRQGTAGHDHTGWLVARRQLLQRRLGQRGVDARTIRRHPMTAGVLGQRLGRVEPHRLSPQQPGAKSRRVVQFQPRRGVDEVGEADRVALRESVVGEGGQLVPDLPDGLGRYSPLGGSGLEPLPQLLHTPARPLAPRAWRSSSASPAENPATSIVICISCSWNSGTPSVFSRAFSRRGWR